ncbi:hypothetical protein PoB_002465500 [Plakobranchus ocellatus]|uniref:CUB domain-containing protein n=1 Tax=Plakobranchus ocellatus TaxID=259542 RepID=A0AAV3ZQY8_9GAST|nr:hypothetical protein PoB_002465500 [Plakobranchus ocellatus]
MKAKQCVCGAQRNVYRGEIVSPGSGSITGSRGCCSVCRYHVPPTTRAAAQYPVGCIGRTARYIQLNAAYGNSASEACVPLQIKCSFDAAKVKVRYVRFLVITQSQISREEEYAVAAMVISTIDMSNYNVIEGRENMPFSNISGQIEHGAKSHLEFTFESTTEGYCQSYTCATKGSDYKHFPNDQVQKIYKTIQVNALNGGSCVGSTDIQPRALRPRVSEQTTSQPLIYEHTTSHSSSIFSTILLCPYSLIVGISIYMLIIQLFTH